MQEDVLKPSFSLYSHIYSMWWVERKIVQMQSSVSRAATEGGV